MYPKVLRRVIGQLAFNYFMFICLIGQRCLILVSSEDMPAIPLNLYEPKFLGDLSDSQIADSYKRGGSSNTAFYGLRGKKQSDATEITGDADKRGAFYPVRGKKPTAFTALRGKKVLNLNDVGDEFANSKDNSTLSQFLTNLKNDAWNSGVAKMEAILNEEMKQPGHLLNTHSQTADDYADSWEDSTHKGQLIYSPIEETDENNPWTYNTKFIAESRKGNNADDLTNSDDDDDNGGKEMPMDKRRTSGFIPMRGRKLDSDEADAQFSADKRRASGFFPMRGRKSDSDETDAQFFADKRRTSGFFPMRGRKSDSDKAATQFFADKRRTSGFIPMRGRKSEADAMFFEDKKKSAFIPMRGRRSHADAMYFADKKKSAFIPMRGRRTDNSDDDAGSSSNENAEFPENRYNFAPLTRSRRSIWNQNGINNFNQRQTTGNQRLLPYPRWPLPQGKRMAFHAVRGKKYSLPMDWNYLQRAFHTSREGKLEDSESGSSDDTSKSFDSSVEEHQNPENRISASRVKRSMQRKMSRGKSRSTIAIKRPITFFATRGKRFGENTMEPSSSFLLI